MTDLADAPPFEDSVDHMAQGPVIEKAANEQLGRQRGPRVDRYAIEPKTASSQP